LDDPVIIVVWLENEGEETERLNSKFFRNNSEFVIAANKSQFNLSKRREKKQFFKVLNKIHAKNAVVLLLISKSTLKGKIGENYFEEWEAFDSDKLNTYPCGVIGYQFSFHETPDILTTKRILDIERKLIHLNKSQARSERQSLSGAVSEWHMEDILVAIIDDLKALMKKLEENQKEKLKRIERHESEIKNIRQRQEWSKWRVAALKAALTAADH
jgi:hypothetical protein